MENYFLVTRVRVFSSIFLYTRSSAPLSHLRRTPPTHTHTLKFSYRIYLLGFFFRRASSLENYRYFYSVGFSFLHVHRAQSKATHILLLFAWDSSTSSAAFHIIFFKENRNKQYAIARAIAKKTNFPKRLEQRKNSI